MALMTKLLDMLVGVLLAATLAQPGVRGAAQGDEFRWHKGVAAGSTVEIKGVSGEIRAEAAAGSEVEVTAHKHGRRDDPALVKVEVVEHAGGVTLCAVYPSPDGRANECAPGRGGRMNTRDNDVAVDFEVRVPAGVRFTAHNVNGGVQARGLDADVEAHSVNGGVQIDTAGVAHAESVNGTVRASMGRADWTGRLDFKTVNGSIRLELPPDVGAEVSAETVNGSITTDFPLSVRGRLTGRSLTGTIGGGGRELHLSSVNGSIELRRAR